jgi:glycerol-3-phosphate O-acyltransferase
MQTWLRLVGATVKMGGYPFESMHAAIRGQGDGAPGYPLEPGLDYYAFGNDFFRPMLNLAESRVLDGTSDRINEIREMLERGENVVMFSNHQTEADPQVISMMFESLGASDIGERVTCVAGHKVTTDPLCIPFSMGRNLICIHSKKHIGSEPDLVAEKRAQNVAAMSKVEESLKQGGALIWLAPSGGRDRPGPDGVFKVAPFDPKSVQMFEVLGRKALKSSKWATHFFPMAIKSHRLVPPPDELSKGVGEKRSAKRAGVGIALGHEADPANGNELAALVEAEVKSAYAKLAAVDPYGA